MPYPDRLDPEKIKTLIRQMEFENVPFPEAFLTEGNPLPQVQGKWFCPLQLQRIIDTFPPVWNFKPMHYVLRFNALDAKHELYIGGRVREKGYLKYYLGEMDVRITSFSTPA